MNIDIAHIEAVLFAAAKPLTYDVLADIFESPKDDIILAVKELESYLVHQNRGIRIRISGMGVELVSAPEASEYIGQIRRKEDKLSNAAMETLAVIAFKQPVTKAEVEEIRGVNSDKVLKQLLSRGLVSELGHKDSIGRPILYGTTDEFLRSVGVNSLADLHEEVTHQDDRVEGTSDMTMVTAVDTVDETEALNTNSQDVH